VEDLNKLITIHVQRCVQRKDPSIVTGDLEDLLKTGFLSLNHTLRGVGDNGLIPRLVTMWMDVFGKILPFMQAVFLPLDQEFKGRGTILTSPKMAAEFWEPCPVTTAAAHYHHLLHPEKALISSSRLVKSLKSDGFC